MTPEVGKELARGDVRAEKAVIGALLIDPDALERVSRIVGPEDFSRPAGRVIFAAMLALRDRGMAVDYVTVASEIERGPGFKAIGGIATLTALVNECPTSLHAEFYAQCIAQAAADRWAEEHPAEPRPSGSGIPIAD